MHSRFAFGWFAGKQLQWIYHIISIMLMLPATVDNSVTTDQTDRSNANANEICNQHEAHTHKHTHVNMRTCVSGLSFDQYK